LRSLVIIGAGGFGLEVLRIVLDIGVYEVAGFIDREAFKRDSTFQDLPIIGDDEEIVNCKRRGISAATVCVGNWEVRRRLFEKAMQQQLELPRLVHPSAYVASDVAVGLGTIVYPGAVIMNGCRLGRGVVINAGATLGHEVVVNDFCNINPGANIAGRVTLGEGVLVGIGSTILERRMIGDGARVGAGALVVKNVGKKTTVIGVPACPVPGSDDAERTS